MILHTMTVPDDPAEFPRWLERRLMAPDFGRFIAELMAYFPNPPKAPPLRQLFAKWLPVALAEGLDSIPRDVLTQLLKQPAVLAQFQERILTEGGEYWDTVPVRSKVLDGAFENGKRSLDRIFSTDTLPTVAKETPQAMPQVKATAIPKVVPSEVRTRRAGLGTKIWAITSTAVAACLLLAIGYLEFTRPLDPPVMKSQIAWGWGKPSGLAAPETTAKGYLKKLADNAEEWSLDKPGDASGVGTRLAEFRAGCTRLMHSPYGPLAPSDKAWLLEQCREWAKMLDGHQQALDAGADPLAVRAQVDATVQTIATTLREKAKQVG